MYYSWSKEFLEAGKPRLAGDTAREATSDEAKTLAGKAFVIAEGPSTRTQCMSDRRFPRY